MTEMIERTKPLALSGDQWEAVREIIGFFDHEYFSEVLLASLDSAKDAVEDITGSVRYAMMICGVFYNNRALSVELDEVFGVSAEYDRGMMAAQYLRAEEYRAEGYDAFIIGDDVFAFDSDSTVVSDNGSTRIWRLAKSLGCKEDVSAEVREKL